MLPDLRSLFAPATMGRLTLLLNHVLSREEAAVQRLQPHAGAVLELVPEGWPSLLPRPPEAVFRITPAGLLEWVGTPSQPPSLRVVIDASNPAALGVDLISGIPPAARVEGDSRLAGDIDWLLANLRWDIADDLEAIFGPTVAQLMTSVGRAVRQGLDVAMKGSADLVARWRRPPP
jgi:ubiquinone biosynthesis accessory factor UbiJ